MHPQPDQEGVAPRTRAPKNPDADTGNAALRELLDLAGLSNSALARSVVAAGAAEGVPLGTTATSVRRMLDGTQPHWPVPRLVAAVLARRMGREVSVEECGFHTSRFAASDNDGLACAGTLDGTIQAVLSLSGQDMNRRSFLLGSTFVVGGFAQPALLALAGPPTEPLVRRVGPRVGTADVEVLTQQLSHLRQLDHNYGAGKVRDHVVALVNRGSQLVLHGSYSHSLGKALLEAVAQAAWLAGLMASDVGRPALAQRYYAQALNLAMSAGSQRYAANVLSHMSRLTLHMGAGLDHDDLVLHARQAVALARTGLTLDAGNLSPGQRALLHAMEARGSALAGDTQGSRVAISAAETSYARSHPDTEPIWLAFYTPAELEADLGRTLADLGDHKPAVRALTTALDTYEPWRTRSRCFVTTDLATVHLRAGKHELAAAAAHSAATAAGIISSTRATQRIEILQKAVSRCAPRSQALRRLNEELTHQLTHSGPDSRTN
jgi:hypothetical protein